MSCWEDDGEVNVALQGAVFIEGMRVHGKLVYTEIYLFI